mmetsp:Transcript_1145/g.1035  ORF Transcript_1145/g.1035 Transcript_1145/m.1035 type:complete len:185 (+) Transcript_1145:297-851(+)
MIFDHVVEKSVNTERKITGCSRQNYKKVTHVKFHYKDNEIDTVQKLWKAKKKDYGVLREFMLKGNVNDYYHKLPNKNRESQDRKIRRDFCSSEGNVPGNSLGKRKNFKRDVAKITRKKMNEVESNKTYRQPLNAMKYNSHQKGSVASLSTMHSISNPIKSKRNAPKTSQHRYQFKRVHKLKYAN